MFSLDQSHVDRIKAANPSLASTEFVTPNGPDRPFLVVGAAAGFGFSPEGKVLVGNDLEGQQLNVPYRS